MKLQLWRNATLQLKLNSSQLLIDPMLGNKGSFGEFPWTNDNRENPLVDLPFSNSELALKLKNIDAVFVSHLHPDHWDEAAVNLLSKSTPIICPEPIAQAIASYGFNDVQPFQTEKSFNDINLHLTTGKHGTGEIGQKMGLVNGLILNHNNQKVYFAGDTVWCDDVKEAIDKHQPQHIIVAGGAATFAIGEPVTMTAEHIQQIARSAPGTKIWVTHLEAISPCTENRAFLSSFLQSHNLENQCKILKDGEEAELLF
ncbi:MBL fold metallo-hydrolase [Cyclobacterium roseum]|uniref:MBL fold metallo-hydrolase n=1 Tax=Cyclobacterium roseum TaxID=2666137 RepID=UPI00139154E6|nr:MBL fold metallo-hydrolase [Cyclobacterium roseum]